MASGGNENNVIGYTAAKGGLLNLTYQLALNGQIEACVLTPFRPVLLSLK